MHGLLTAVTSLVVEHRLQSSQASVVVAQGLSCPDGMWNLPRPRIQLTSPELGAFLVAQLVKRHGFDPWVDKIPWRRVWQPSPLFLPEESYGQRSLVGYSPWGRTELDTTE